MSQPAESEQKKRFPMLSTMAAKRSTSHNQIEQQCREIRRKISYPQAPTALLDISPIRMAFSRPLLSFLCILPALAFNNIPFRQRTLQRKVHLAVAGNDLGSVDVTVKATDLDDSLGLSPEEKTVVNIHRVCSPSVVYVTSVLLSSSSPVSSARTRRRGKKNTERDNSQKQKNKLPNGMSLGSGSGFVIDSEGYIVTNYHVVQSAYESNQAVLQYEKFWHDFAKNTTQNIKEKLSFSRSNVMDNVEGVLNRTVNAITGRERDNGTEVLPAGIFVRFGENGDTDGSITSYYSCEIVDVKKELDIAVLKIIESSDKITNLLKPMQFGSSSNLVVGQSLVAIGNPFGLDRTITSGLVSATGRSVTGVAGNQIKNCIQTDCAINPGNSGGKMNSTVCFTISYRSCEFDSTNYIL